MAPTFDPYREWLGIERGRSAADFYRVFGLPAFTDDPQVIDAAARLTIDRIKQLPAGPQAVDRDALVKELSQARRCLLDPAARARYDAKLRGDLGQATAPVAKASPAPPVVDNEASPVDELFAEVTRVPYRLQTAPKRNRGSGLLAAAGVVFGCGLVLAGLVYWQMQSDRPGEPTVAAARQVLPEQPRAASRPDEPSPAPRDEPPAVRPQPPDVPAETKGPPPAATEPVVRRPKETPATATASPSDMADAADTVQKTPATIPAVPDDAKSAARRAIYQRAVTRAAAALAARNLAEAARQLELAETNVVLPAQLEETKQLRALAEELERFHGAVRAGLKKFEPTEQIHFGDTIAAIVEVDRDRVVLFIEGARRVYTVATMPPEMILFFARAGADEKNPAAAGFYGAYYFVQGNVERARQLWQQAAAAELPVDDLLALAAGPALAERREPVPERQLVDAAGVELQGRFADAIVAANTNARRSQASAKFLQAARQSDDSAEQYAALEQARDWAVLAGDPAAALAALDELGKWFDVDALQLKSQALGTALAGRVTAKSAADAATEAMRLSAAAVRAGRGELARTLADTAYSAARKSRDGALVKRAYQWRTKVRSGGK